MVPSAGPTYGLLIEQARIVRRHAFPTVMVLPQQGITTSVGVANGIREFVAAAGVPAIVYVKNDGYIEPEEIAALDKEGLVSAIKYAVVRKDTSNDPYLRKLTHTRRHRQDHQRHRRAAGDHACARLRAGGLHERVRLRGAEALAGDAGAVQRQDWAEAERIRGIFTPLEDLRNAINPIRVLHQAVESAGIAETGPLLPLLSNVGAEHVAAIAAAARALLAENGGNSSPGGTAGRYISTTMALPGWCDPVPRARCPPPGPRSDSVPVRPAAAPRSPGVTGPVTSTSGPHAKERLHPGYDPVGRVRGDGPFGLDALCGGVGRSRVGHHARLLRPGPSGAACRSS